MEATVKVPEVKVIGTDGKPLTKESRELNAEVSGYLDQMIQDYKKDVAAVQEGDEGHEDVTSDYRIVTGSKRLFSLRVDTVIDMGGSDSFTKIYNIDKKTGKKIALKDLFREGSDYKKVISDSIKVFNKYEVAPGYMGMVEFSIPNDKISDIVIPEYMEK